MTKDKRKLKNIKGYKCILAFNDSEECYLFETEEEAKEEAFRTLRDENVDATEAYILNFQIKSTLKIRLEEKN